MKNPQLAAIFVTLTLGKLIASGWAGDAPSSSPPLPASPAQRPINRQATADAWTALRAGDYGLALTKANECIDRFQGAADGIQTLLEKDRTTLPTGAASSADRQRIDQYQILHDVATCLLIKAWAEEHRGRKGEAIKAYAKVKKYSYARATEHAGEPFWSPSEIASQHLSRLTQ